MSIYCAKNNELRMLIASSIVSISCLYCAVWIRMHSPIIKLSRISWILKAIKHFCLFWQWKTF